MKTLLIIIFSCWGVFLTAQNTDLNQSTISDSSFYAEIPFKIVSGNIIVKIEIQGESYDFMLDTGAPLLVSKKLSDKLNFPILEQIPVSDQSEKIDTMEVVMVGEFKFGGVNFVNGPALVAENNPILECYDIEGLIGSNVLKSAIVQIDKQKQQVIITNQLDRLNLPKPASELYLNTVQSSPFLNIQLKGAKGKANEQLLFDTGMDALYDLSENHYNIFEEHANLFEEIEHGYGNNTFGLHGAAENDEYLRGVLPGIKLGKLTIENVKFLLTKDNNSRIGNHILDYGVATLDYINKQFYFEPIEKKVQHEETRFPINPTYSDGKFVVGIIWEDSLKSKIDIGDEIILINGKQYKGMTLCELIQKNSIFKNAKVDQLEILLIHEGKQKTIFLNRRAD